MNRYETPLGQRYRLKRHARNQMKLRGVSRSDVEKVLDHHNVSHPDKKGNPCFIGDLDDGRRIRLVASAESEGLAVITVIILR